jgi:hypothetical protein
MHREDVNLIDTDEPIHDSIGRANDFTYGGVFELRYGAAGFRELDQAPVAAMRPETTTEA